MLKRIIVVAALLACGGAWAQSSCVVTASAPNYAPYVGQSAACSLDFAGNIRTTAAGGGSVTANQGTANTVGNGWPVYLEFGGVALPLGQALSAVSIPVVLPATQITTLTPPAAITNYELETGGNAAIAATGIGAPADAAYSGSGSSSIIAALKGIYAKLAGTLSFISSAQQPTYWASAIGYSPVATATDMSCMIGSATKTVTVTNAVMYVNSTTSATQALYIIKRSTANSGGTPTTLTPTLYESTDSAATASVVTYGANPTTGTGTAIRYNQITSPVVTSPAVAFSLATFAANGSTVTYQKNIVLHGVAESLCFNYNGAALAGTLLTVAFEWEWTEK